MANSNRKLSRRSVLKAGILTGAALTVGLPVTKKVLADTVGTANETSQIGFFYDQGKCIGCGTCATKCNLTWRWPKGAKWRKVIFNKNDIKTRLSMSCNHCENPACMTVCPVKAYTKREKDGIVVHHEDRCVGCGYCMYACPYNVPQYSETKGYVSKCSFCASKQDAGEQPACVSVCPTGALAYGNLAELKKQPGLVSQIAGMPSPELTNPSFVILPIKE
ncbi:4Fe-4S binding protein [Dehalobacter sp. DCM]|uniref:4Fe-4S dicluster domain-containing protein n=1 Tax=Dehalobacter sp. DCM TaxID=2907827 RepID=UPI003081D4B0|nr:4Fe-4S binding protein [Dehalobacter sp. DCM]